MIKIISIDLDGTLFDSRAKISKRNREVIYACIKKGIKIIITTGKSAAFSTKLIKELGLANMHILSNGSLIVNSDLKPAYIFKIPEITYRKIVRFFRKKEHGITVHTLEGAYYEIENPYFSEISGSGESLIKVEDILSGKISGTALMCTYAGPIGNALYNSFCNKFKNEVQIVRGGRFLTDIFSVEAGKVNAIKRILEMYNIDRSEFMAIGDNENDIGMIKFAGIGIAMDNSLQIIKDAADDVVSSNDNDGVAEALYKYALNFTH